MKKIICMICLIAMSVMSAMAQIDGGRSKSVTMFPNYVPATITLTSGGLNHQKQANIFLKNGSLIYMKGSTVMEANMDVIKSVKFGDRNFIKMNKELVEVIDSIGPNLLVLSRIINQEDLKHEMLNSSTITNINIGDQLGVTRLDANADQLVYPVDETYYFIIGKKHIAARDREARVAAGRKRVDAFDSIVRSYGFSWKDKEYLMKILEVLSR